jgi:nitroimidazol reductase NimA-like FMN-containing flavoprotein (pyridoxamine 5'-phosphate oxidase superfamily)
MLGKLDDAQIEHVLRSQTVGRLGIHAEGRTYVVPVTYVYDGDAIYGHSSEGQKIRMMRANPAVCFEVEDIETMADWRTVIVWGEYQELSGDLATACMNLLHSRLAPITTSETAGPAGRHAAARDGVAVAYRIRPNVKTGRFEKPML